MNGSPFPLWSPQLWRAYGITLRPYLLFVSGAGGLLGLALVPAPAPAATSLAIFAALFFAYGLGQALTDVFQIDTDRISSPYRPLVRGEISSAQVLGLSAAGLALCGLVLAVHSPATLVLAALSVLGLLTYTPLKRRWWGGPAWNAWIVALLPGLGYLAGARAPLAALASVRIALAAASCFFSYAVFVILGYLKDARADRATGYQTVVVRFGSQPAILCSAGCALAAVVASTALVVPVALAPGRPLPAIAGAGLWAWGLVTLVFGHLQGWRVERDEEAFPAVASSVRGFVALHLGEAALLRPEWTWSGLALLALFELFLRARPERSQI